MVTASAAEPFARDQWIADFEQLKSALTAGYPNLEWAAKRGMDLAAHEQRTRERLSAATDDTSARAALERFVGGFGDGHMRLTWEAAAEVAPAHDQPLCARLGYFGRPDTSAIARDLPGYQSLPAAGGPLAVGTVDWGGRKLGVLRVLEFMPDIRLCENAVRELEIDASQPCDGACGERIEKHAEGALVASLVAAIRTLVDTKPDVLLVDVSGNGGGNDSAVVAARMLTRAPLAAPRMTFVRSAARAADLREDMAELDRAIKRAGARQRQFVRPLLARLGQASHEAAQSCDLSPLWLRKPAPCSNLLNVPFFAGGLVDDELPPDLRGRPWARQVSATARYQYTPSLWTGPLAVLVDWGSASATELFAAMLQDDGRALIVGSPTVGSGCGWTLRQAVTELTHSRGRLVMPDCARLRRDGTNELDGIQPDVLIGFRRYDTALQRARRLAAALPAIGEAIHDKHRAP
jgi:hypothetical protein